MMIYKSKTPKIIKIYQIYNNKDKYLNNNN